jgi:hypothetical protein
MLDDSDDMVASEYKRGIWVLSNGRASALDRSPLLCQKHSLPFREDSGQQHA